VKIREILSPYKRTSALVHSDVTRKPAVASPEKRRFLFGGDVTRSPAEFPGHPGNDVTRNGRFPGGDVARNGFTSDTPGHPAESQTQTKFVVSYRTQHRIIFAPSQERTGILALWLSAIAGRANSSDHERTTGRSLLHPLHPQIAAAEGVAVVGGFRSTHNEGGRGLHTRSYTCNTPSMLATATGGSSTPWRARTPLGEWNGPSARARITRRRSNSPSPGIHSRSWVDWRSAALRSPPPLVSPEEGVTSICSTLTRTLFARIGNARSASTQSSP